MQRIRTIGSLGQAGDDDDTPSSSGAASSPGSTAASSTGETGAVVSGGGDSLGPSDVLPLLGTVPLPGAAGVALGAQGLWAAFQGGQSAAALSLPSPGSALNRAAQGIKPQVNVNTGPVAGAIAGVLIAGIIVTGIVVLVAMKKPAKNPRRRARRARA
jgi:hypothetical protein